MDNNMNALINPNPRTNWRPNDIVYYYDEVSNKIVMGKIIDTIFAKDLAYIHDINGPKHGTRHYNELFDDQTKASKTLSDMIDAKTDMYCADIKTVDDLLKFALNHNLQLHGVYPDNTAERKAFIKMSQELLQIDVLH